MQFQLRQAQRENEELRVANGSLGERIDTLSAQSSSPGPRSLLREMECDDDDDDESRQLIVRGDRSAQQLDGVSCVGSRLWCDVVAVVRVC